MIERGRGRPRPAETIERDEEIFNLIRVARSREELARILYVNDNVVYLSLTRLRRAGRAAKVRSGKYHRWVQTTTHA